MKRIWFVSNFVFGNQISGGVIHYLEMAKACQEAGYDVRFLGGSGMQRMLAKYNLDLPVEVTDARETGINEPVRLQDQLAVFRDNYRRCRNSFAKLDLIQPDDIAYAVTDYWCDTLPVICSRASKKLLILGMDAPTLREIALRSRPDVTASRLGSIHYWLSQNLSLGWFRRLGNKRLFYVHPDMKPRLLALGYREAEMVFISNGMNLKAVEQVPPQPKAYDVVWLGRIHRQKGIDDLLAVLVVLAKEIKDFRAVLVGRLAELAPRLAGLNLSHCVTLTGPVSEGEKFRFFKASRVFLMPSRQESWGIVIAEALACDVPVVAYDLPAYRPIFGNLIDYVPPFDFEMFKRQSIEAVARARRGEMVLDARELALLKSEHSWAAAGNRFLATLKAF